MRNFDVAIIGGGASGLACAARLSEVNRLSAGSPSSQSARLSAPRKLNIAVIEADSRVGKKLASTGNGQGNVSNLNVAPANYRGGNRRVLDEIISGDPYSGLDVFGGVLFCADARGRIYPAGKQASALCDSLINTLTSNGVEILLSSRVTSVVPAARQNANGGFTVVLENGEKLTAKAVVLATGGKSQCKYNADGSAYGLATALGHTIVPLFPSLVQLKTLTAPIKTARGIRVESHVRAVVNGQVVKECAGDVIFTEYGVTGNAIFGVSPAFAGLDFNADPRPNSTARANSTARPASTHNSNSTTRVEELIASNPSPHLCIDLLPAFTQRQITSALKEKLALGTPAQETLSGILHNQLGRAVVKYACELTGVEYPANARLVPPEEVAACVKNFCLNVTGTLGFDSAQVTRGGIDMNEVTQNLESKLCPNFFITGEALDVDGDCGGYNLRWAFLSAKRVAEELIKRS